MKMYFKKQYLCATVALIFLIILTSTVVVLAGSGSFYGTLPVMQGHTTLAAAKRDYAGTSVYAHVSSISGRSDAYIWFDALNNDGVYRTCTGRYIITRGSGRSFITNVQHSPNQWYRLRGSNPDFSPVITHEISGTYNVY